MRRKMCDSINTLLTKLLRSKQLLLFLLSKTKDGVRFPVWKLGATCSLFTLYLNFIGGVAQSA